MFSWGYPPWIGRSLPSAFLHVLEAWPHGNITLVSFPGLEESQDFERAMQQLFTAKWNIPQAAAAIGMKASQRDWEKMKAIFADYCKDNPPQAWGHD